jgi:RimJ/RimL family protein N-acetyltransferase
MSTQTDVLLRRLRSEDAEALRHFYDDLGEQSKRLFHPLGEDAGSEQYQPVIEGNLPECDKKYDLVALSGKRIVGWAFLWHDTEKREEAIFGIAVADSEQGKGLGRRLMDALMAIAGSRGLKRVHLTVVRDNERARRMYEASGFVRTGSFLAGDGLDYDSMVKDLRS